jgi:hypothetical protein
MAAALFCLAFLVNFAFGQQQPPYSNQFPQPTQNPFPSQQQQGCRPGDQLIGNTCYPPQSQQPQQPPTATFQPPQQTQQYPSQLEQQFQRPQQQQQSNSTFMPLYNVSQVMACLHKSLADSMIKGAATGMLTIRNNTNGTVTGGINEQFLTNATTNLDNCILPMR